MEFKSAYKQLNRKVNTWCKYTKRLDTYGMGCQHGCKYCYAKGLLNFRGKWNEYEPLKSNLMDIVKKIKLLHSGCVVRMGSMTDCFQPMEIENRITYQTIKLLNHYKIHYLIITKSNLVSKDEYLQIYDKNLAHFQISITSTDNEISSKYEKASQPSERIKSVEKLFSLGFDVSIRLSPFIEQFIDFDILNNISCDKILIEFLKVNYFVKNSFDIDYSDCMVNCGGYKHLPLFKKLQLIKKVNGFKEVSVGEYVKEHHEYFKQNINYNKNDCCNLKLNFRPIYKQLELWNQSN